MVRLTVKQTRFAECYCGNATEAAIQAGYSPRTARSQGQRMLTKVDILSAIKGREDQRIMGKIATREERQEFWTNVMMNEGLSMHDRLRASDLLGKSEGDYVIKAEPEGIHGLAERLQEARLMHQEYMKKEAEKATPSTQGDVV